ncbi:hypothetical protein STEG23_031624, partial [Scotinomys teguina]
MCQLWTRFPFSSPKIHLEKTCEKKPVAAPRDAAEIHKDVQNYYGNVLKTSADLQTNACVTPVTLIPKYIRETLKNVHEDVTSRSNCVINLVPDKQQVLREVYHVLKYGGELYFSDVYASLEVPEDTKSHMVLWGECLGGALYWKDLAIIAQKIGFCPPRLVTANIITVQNKELESVIGDCRFVSATFRLFKLPKTEPAKRCQVVYKGGITGHEKELIFDANFTFKEGEALDVDGETAAVLKNSRFARNFLFTPVHTTRVGATLLAAQGCSGLETKTAQSSVRLTSSHAYILAPIPSGILPIDYCDFLLSEKPDDLSGRLCCNVDTLVSS